MRDRSVWRFDDYELDLDAWRLSKAGQSLSVEPKGMALLALLLERRGEVVTKGEILDEVWKGVAVTEGAIVRVVAQLRGALGDDAKHPRYIETVHTRGYRFVAEAASPVVEPKMVDSPPSLLGDPPPGAEADTSTDDARPPEGASGRGRKRPVRRLLAYALVLLAAGAAVYLARGPLDSASPSFGDTSDHATRSSIAVLPLESLGGPDPPYFADGMTEALTTQLAKIEALKVMSRGAVLRYRDRRPPPQEIARELAVTHLVEGSAFLADGRVRVSASLVEGASGRTLWAESYEGALADVLALQARIAREIVREVRVRVSTEEEVRLSTARQIDPTAYQEYLRGLFHYERALAMDGNMFPSLREAVRRFELALESEPTWGEAYGALAQTHLRLAGLSDNHPERLREYAQTRRIAEQALELDPTVVSARIALARAAFFLDGDWEAADREFLEVLRLEPNNADWSYGIFLTYAGRFDEALERLRAAEERWPTGTFIRYQIGLTYLCAGRLDEVEKEAAALRADLDDQVQSRLLEAMALRSRGRFAEAVQRLESGRTELMVNRATSFLQELALAAAEAGHTEKARAAIHELEALGGRAGPPILLALDGEDAAMQRVDELQRTNDYTLLMARCWPSYERLRAIPRVAAVLRTVAPPNAGS